MSENQASISEFVEKKITWNGSAWECEPLNIKVIYGGKEQKPVDIGPEDIHLSDTKDWLKMGTPQLQGDKSWLVPVKIQENTMIEPPDISSDPVYTVGDLPRPSPALKTLGTTAEVTVKFRPGDIAGAALAAAGGMVPGLAGAAAGAVPEVTLSSSVAFVVEPPQVNWEVQKDNLIKLSGSGQAQGLTLASQLLPPGWGKGVTVTFALPMERGKNLGLSLAVKGGSDSLAGLNPDPVIAGGTPDLAGAGGLGDLPAGGAGEKGSKPERLQTELSVFSSKLCIRPVQYFQENPVPSTSIPLYVSVRSTYLGSQVSQVPLDALALEVSIYFNEEPAVDYFAGGREQYIRVMRKGSGRIPPRSQLRIQLKQQSLDVPAPPVRWEFPEDQMDDRFSSPSNTGGLYLAPGEESWKEAGEPGERLIRCVAGGHQEEIAVEGEGDLYETVFLEETVYLLEPLGMARLKVRLGPSDLVNNPELLDLSTREVMTSLVREFYLNVDLQYVKDNNSVKQGG